MLLRVKLRVGGLSSFEDETSDVRAMVGLTVSTVSVSELLESKPSWLVLPAELENVELAMEITPLLVLSSVGVKVAV